jgi:hypothetical protein
MCVLGNDPVNITSYRLVTGDVIILQLGFFKRQYKKMGQNPDEMDETTELNS